MKLNVVYSIARKKTLIHSQYLALKGTRSYTSTIPMTPPLPNENTSAQMRKGVLEYCILLIIARAPVYASDILNELKKANLIVVEGTLYPLLSRLRTAGVVTYQWVESLSGPPRKYYELTPQGKKLLEELTQHWKQLTATTQSLIKKYEKDH